MSEKIKILIVEHDSSDIELLNFVLTNGGIDYVYELAEDEPGFTRALKSFVPDIILSDFSLPAFSGIVALQLAQKLAPLIPFIIVSGAIGEERAVEIIKNGATDYAIKDKLFSLPTKITRALNELKEKRDKLVAEKERAKMTEDLIKRNKDLEQFAYIVSHNLRSPVAKILGLSALLHENIVDAQETKEIVGAVSESVEKLDEVIKDLNNILNVHKEINEKNEPVSFTSLLSNIHFSIKDLIEKENVKIVSDFTAVDKITTVKSYIHSIFYNLISNSIKYRNPDVPSLIEIKSEKINDKVVLLFKDNGIGIDMERNGGKVFGLYKRFHTHVEGKGMGLFMVKTQVESIGGTINVTSKPGAGTTFIIEFPAAMAN